MEEKSIENENEYLFQWKVIPIFYFELFSSSSGRLFEGNSSIL